VVDGLADRKTISLPKRAIVVQVKYTNPCDREIAQVHSTEWAGKYAFGPVS
jgi:hypothetical protein